MSAKANVTTDMNLESGNVAALLGHLSGSDEQEITERLESGTNPRLLAEELGVAAEFCKIVTNRVRLQLNAAVRNSSLSRRSAQELEESFEKGFMNQ